MCCKQTCEVSLFLVNAGILVPSIMLIITAVPLLENLDCVPEEESTIWNMITFGTFILSGLCIVLVFIGVGLIFSSGKLALVYYLLWLLILAVACASVCTIELIRGGVIIEESVQLMTRQINENRTEPKTEAYVKILVTRVSCSDTSTHRC
ncbi:unnamed protein product [Calicophoron daubneyi]|uniref:Tetraspanin n=1 Tax=Calicophoron daubneyi TaxID=300641 RepID=A0AAV2TQS3_CALDB